MPRMLLLRARAQRPPIIHTIALASVLAACTVAPGGSPTPTADLSGGPSPSGSPSGSPPGTPPGTPPPSASPSPTPSPTFDSDQIEHPTGAMDIVLRMDNGGGFVPREVNLTHVPQFTLYGDGMVVFRSSRQWTFGEPLPPLLTGQMTEEGIQALLAYALDTGRLANAREHYENNTIADASTTVFNLNAGGVQKVVSIYALSETSGPGPDAAERAGFAQLQDLLMNFDREAESTLDEVALYEPELYRVVMLESMGEPVGPPIEWPWDDLTMNDFPSGDEPGGIAILDAEHLSKLMEVPNGGQFGIWVEDPDGNIVQAAVRPLLPDEVEAAGL